MQPDEGVLVDGGEVLSEATAPPDLTSPVDEAATASPPEPSLEDLLQQFDQAVSASQPAAPQPAVVQPVVQQPAGLSPQEQEWLTTTNQMLQQQRAENERRDVQAFVDETAKELAEFDTVLPGGAKEFADRWYTAEYLSKPELQVAWRYRDADPGAIEQELNNVRHALEAAKKYPAWYPYKPEQLQQYARELQIGLYAKNYLASAKNRLRKLAYETSQYDRQVTEDREAVRQAVRGASGPAYAEPPPNLGQMDQKEFERYTRKEFGF
jgi:DNA repair ATPase RecN